LKSIPLTPQARSALGLPDNITTMTPTELIHAILLGARRPAVERWHRHVRQASTESHADAGDKANDAVRADGAQLRAKVVGEGGNLGLTQLGRIEFARAGGRINTDAIDNSAGRRHLRPRRSTEDPARPGRRGRAYRPDERNRLLASVGDEVAALCLRGQLEQNVLLAMTRYIGPAMVTCTHGCSRRSRTRAGWTARWNTAVHPRAGPAVRPPARGLVPAGDGRGLRLGQDRAHRDDRGLDAADEPWFQRVLHDYSRAANRRQRRRSTWPRTRCTARSFTTCVSERHGQPGRHELRAPALEETGSDPAQITRAYNASPARCSAWERLWPTSEALDNQGRRWPSTRRTPRSAA